MDSPSGSPEDNKVEDSYAKSDETQEKESCRVETEYKYN
jgi:hypothetical protein